MMTAVLMCGVFKELCAVNHWTSQLIVAQLNIGEAVASAASTVVVLYNHVPIAEQPRTQFVLYRIRRHVARHPNRRFARLRATRRQECAILRGHVGKIRCTPGLEEITILALYCWSHGLTRLSCNGIRHQRGSLITAQIVVLHVGMLRAGGGEGRPKMAAAVGYEVEARPDVRTP